VSIKKILAAAEKKTPRRLNFSIRERDFFYRRKNF